jgi:hypothetical protein
MRFASSGLLSVLLAAACGGSSTAPDAQAPVAVTEVSLVTEGRAERVQPDQSDSAAENRAAIEEMQSAGVLGALSSEQNDAFVALLGTSGIDEIGGLQGATVGEAFGTGGLGLRGVGTGGGGSGQPIGIGTIGTIGQGGGTGTGGGIGRGSGAGFSGYGSGRVQSTPPPRVKLGAPTVQGALDPEIVRRVLRRHLAAIRYCYEKEQVKSPQLAGEVRLAFTIGARGEVAAVSVASTTLQSTAVESCLLGRMRTMMFPEPEKGIVLVDVTMEFTTPPPPTPPAAPPATPSTPGGTP